MAVWDFGAGKATYSLGQCAIRPTYEAIFGDRAARKAAKSLKVNIRGTLSIFLLAKQTGHIASASTEILS